MPSSRSKVQVQNALRALATKILKQDEENVDPAENQWVGIKLQDAASMRPELQLLRTLESQGKDTIDAVIEKFRSSEMENPGRPPNSSYLRCALLKEDGNMFFKQKQYRKAIEEYKKAMRVFLEDDATLPSPCYLNKAYLSIDEEGWKTIIDLIACTSNIAQCYNKLGEFLEMIDWIEEIEIVYICYKQVAKPHEPSWRDYHRVLVEYFTLHIKSQHRAHLLLCNSSLAMSYGNRAYCNTILSEGAEYRERITELERLIVQIDLKEMVEWWNGGNKSSPHSIGKTGAIGHITQVASQGSAQKLSKGNSTYSAVTMPIPIWARISLWCSIWPQCAEPPTARGHVGCPAQRRLYVLYGNANRSGAHHARKAHGNPSDYTYDPTMTSGPLMSAHALGVASVCEATSPALAPKWLQHITLCCNALLSTCEDDVPFRLLRRYIHCRSGDENMAARYHEGIPFIPRTNGAMLRP
ncbi:hypothetical protein EW145_g5945 [Phellinidium pouzarii]|uniref:Uncharacterized protein n=1 Tax=Phellinidium pouzarii TaxID=167371 RepID=A0A4S4KY87_9AGAM|nr:hypothetical protein EW145_g5945 [Phellinidium pouzarii]